MSEPRRRIPALLQRPEQGWSSLFLVLGMLVLVGVSVADARLFPLDATYPSDPLLVLMLAAGLIGFLLARSPLGVVRAHLIGAGVGAIILLLIAAAALQQRSDPVPLSWVELRESMRLLLGQVQAELNELRLKDPASTPTMVPYLVLGAICWTTAQFSAFSVFRYDRGGPAVMAIGVVLFLNIGLATWASDTDLLPVLPQLALFSALAMLLLMRLQLTQQGYQWARRHIADTGEVSRLFLRTGTAFVVLAVAGASSLTIAATTGPHPPPTHEFQDLLDDIGAEIAQYLPIIGVPRESDDPRSLEDSFEVPDKWTPGDGIAFTAEVPGGLVGNYWWLSAHDEFDGWNWGRSGTREERRGADEELRSPQRQTLDQRDELLSTITLDDPIAARTVVSLSDASSVGAPVLLTTSDGGRELLQIDFQDGSEVTERYEVRSQVLDYGTGSDTLTAEQLRSADGPNPRWIESRYLQGTGESSRASGPLTVQAAADLGAGKRNNYDKAIAVQDHLQNMEYSVDLGTTCSDSRNVPECVLDHQEGFCQYYASTMVMILREMEIPSRMVRGFLPGEPRLDGSWEIPRQAYHAWAEAYFPGYGWVRFDPTPGLSLERYGHQTTGFPEPVIDQEGIPEGPSPIPTLEPSVAETPPGGEVIVPPDRGRDDDNAALLAIVIGGGIAGLLLVATFGLLFFRLRRLPDGDGGLAYRGIVSLATRLGYGPHPSQTEYEYASSLSETLPGVRDDLHLVAQSRVETTYGQRFLNEERRDGLRRAYRRIRTALLRLSLGSRR